MERCGLIASRRMLKVPISFEFLSQFMVQGNEFSNIKCVKGLPEDAILIGSSFDADAQIVYLIFMHESFEEVPWGHVMPELQVEHKMP